MCHGRGLNNKINNLHERALRTVYQDKKSSFETLLKHDKSVSIHVKNLQYLATEIFKVKNDLCPEIMKEIFIFHENPTYNSGADTGFRKRGCASKFGRKTTGGDSRGAVSPPSGDWGKAPETFAIRAFTSARIANTYVIIP